MSEAPTIYLFDPDTGELLGHKAARRSPIGDGYILPPPNHRGRTVDPPPAAEDGHAVCRRGGEWVQVEDHRGETAYLKEGGRPVTVMSLGPLPEGMTTLVPPAPPFIFEDGGWKPLVEAPPRDVLAEIDALKAESERLQAALAVQIEKGQITEQEIDQKMPQKADAEKLEDA